MSVLGLDWKKPFEEVAADANDALKKVFNISEIDVSNDCIFVNKRILEAAYRLPMYRLDEPEYQDGLLASFVRLCCVYQKKGASNAMIGSPTQNLAPPAMKEGEEKRVLGGGQTMKVQMMMPNVDSNAPPCGILLVTALITSRNLVFSNWN